MKEIDYRDESVPTHPPHPTDRFADERRSFDAPQPRFENDLPVEFLDDDLAMQQRPRIELDEDTIATERGEDPDEPPLKKRRRRRRSRDREATGWARVEEFERLSRAYYEDDPKGIRVRKLS